MVKKMNNLDFNGDPADVIKAQKKMTHSGVLYIHIFSHTSVNWKNSDAATLFDICLLFYYSSQRSKTRIQHAEKFKWIIPIPPFYLKERGQKGKKKTENKNKNLRRYLFLGHNLG